MTEAALQPELGPTMRAWRERMPKPPESEAGELRHTPGLRRGELAERAGVSAEYVTQIEQGRARTPSGQVLKALASALGLSYQERVHLYELAGRQPPPAAPDVLPASVAHVIPQLETPAALCNAAWDLVQWNSAWSQIIGDAGTLPLNERNIVLRHFYGMPAGFQRDAAQAAKFEAEIVADLRQSAGRDHDDPRLNFVIDDLLTNNDRFRELWTAPAAVPYDSEVKSFIDADLGAYELDCIVMDTRHLNYRVILLSAKPGSVGEVKLDRVRQAR